MSLQSCFTKEYIEQEVWASAWKGAKYVFENPKAQLSYVLSWEDVFETDYFPVNLREGVA
jgi:hypothetical protein